jgi:hypothetical protein
MNENWPANGDGAEYCLIIIDCRAAVQLPEIDRSLVIERQPMHAYLAEYHRELILARNGQWPTHLSIFDDTGGYSRALYRITRSIWLVRDAEASHTVDVTNDTILRDQQRRSGGSFRREFLLDRPASAAVVASSGEGA